MAIDAEDLRGKIVAYCQDDPQLNTVIRKREFGDPLIMVCIDLMVDDFNQICWSSEYTIKTFPRHTLSVQMYGVIYHLLNSATLLQVRNHLPYNDAGLSVAQFAKSGEYSGIADRYQKIFEERTVQVKHQLNLNNAMGGVPSQYSWTGGYATIFGH